MRLYLLLCIKKGDEKALEESSPRDRVSISCASIVCNSCSRKKNLCTIPTKYDYNAHTARESFFGRNYADLPALGLSRSEFVTDPGGIRGSGPPGDGPGRYAEDQHLLLCPMRSNQNGGIENVHSILRMILPKGTVFEPLTQWDIRKAVNHINSVPRGNLSGETPYRAALKNMAPIYSRPGSLHSSFQMK